MSEINKITGIVVGQFGEALQFTIVDSDGQAVDISGYNSTLTAFLRAPFDLLTRTYTATFVTDGTDGQIQFTPATGDIDRAGKWKLQFKLTTSTTRRYTVPAEVDVEEAPE